MEFHDGCRRYRRGGQGSLSQIACGASLFKARFLPAFSYVGFACVAGEFLKLLTHSMLFQALFSAVFVS